MLIRVDENGRSSEWPNPYVHVDTVDAYANEAHPIVSAEFFVAHRDDVVAEKTGLLLDTSHQFSDAIPYRDFALVAISFPTFVDGRGHSLARILRTRFSLKGPIRAVGQILPDQLFFLFRCGFSEFLFDDSRAWSPGDLQRFHEFSVRYQAAADGAEPIYLQK